MKLVLDVNGAYGVVTKNPKSEAIRAQLEKADQVFAPELFFSEAASAAWKYHKIKGVPYQDCLTLGSSSIDLVDVFFPAELLWQEALKIACDQGHSVYDCMYLVVAQQNDAKLASLDNKLLSLAEKVGVEIVQSSTDDS